MAAPVAPEAGAQKVNKDACASACCLVQVPREAIARSILEEEVRSPSLFSQICFCQRAPTDRKKHVAALPEAIAALGGLTLQRGTHSTAGSLQTLKFAAWEPKSRTAVVPVFGAFGQPIAGIWTEPVSTAWYCLINFARCCNYTYAFRFDEGFRRADIDIRSNCCCCVPCVPAWCAVPRWLAHFEMVQADASQTGTEWSRNSSSCGKPMKKTYDLVEVAKADQSPGVHHADFEAYAPKAMLLSR